MSTTAPGSDEPEYVRAHRLGLATRDGTVFADVSLSFDQGRLGVIHGPSGTGRSAVLLGLAGRMRGLTGDLTVAGINAITEPKRLRKITSIARISSLIDLEGQLTVADSLIERSLIDGVRPERSEVVFAHAEKILDCTFPRHALVDELGALERTLLAVALATLRPAHVLLLDDSERGLGQRDHMTLVSALLRLTETGVTMIISSLEPPGDPAAQTYALPR